MPEAPNLPVPAVATAIKPARPSPSTPQLLEWLGNYESARTKDAYRVDVMLWEAHCADKRIAILHPSPGHVTGWIEAMREAGASPATIARRTSAVLSFYKWARWEAITDADPSPWRRPKVKRDDTDILGLTRAQFKAVRDQAGGARNLAFVSLLGYCGLRVSEALNANIGDMRDQSGHHVIRVVGKGNRPRTVAIPPQPWRVIGDYLGDRVDGPIFLTRNGSRWKRREAWETVEAIGRRAGLDGLHPHVLRHTAATLMLEAGAPLDRVQKVLGHASPETTMRYAGARDRLDSSPVYDLARYLAAEE